MGMSTIKLFNKIESEISNFFEPKNTIRFKVTILDENHINKLLRLYLSLILKNCRKIWVGDDTLYNIQKNVWTIQVLIL